MYNYLIFRNFAGKQMISPMNERICLYLTLPPYLAQWYAHECLEIEYKDKEIVPADTYQPLAPVTIPRGSQESRILQCFLKKKPQQFVKEPEDANIALVIPYFHNKDPFYYNYLGKYGREKLIDAIRTRFQLQLWEELHTFKNALSRQDNAIFAFMEVHGIECNETNWNAIAKIYQRLRNAYYKQQSRKNIKNSHREKQPK